MNGPGVMGERLLALFALGVLLFNPPVLSLFGVKGTLFGFPVLYIYLFAAWGALIALIALMARSRKKMLHRRFALDEDGEEA
jgi:hypothetical protein